MEKTPFSIRESVEFRCPACSIYRDDSVVPSFKFEYNDQGLYEFKCDHGHHTFGIPMTLRHEVLFDIGVSAICDGYYREAISSFASALERFFEFFVLVSVLEKGGSYEEYSATWKSVHNSSERQLGAYCATYLIRNQRSATLLPPKRVEFRNNVVHKGKIPTRTEAVDFGESVGKIVVTELRQLYATAADIVAVAHRILLEHVAEGIGDKVQLWGGNRSVLAREVHQAVPTEFSLAKYIDFQVQHSSENQAVDK